MTKAGGTKRTNGMKRRTYKKFAARVVRKLRRKARNDRGRHTFYFEEAQFALTQKVHAALQSKKAKATRAS
jgi:hypothetical protein